MDDVKLKIEVIKTYRGMPRIEKFKLARRIVKIQKVCFQTKEEELKKEIDRIMNIFSNGTIAVVIATYYGSRSKVLDIGIGSISIDNLLYNDEQKKQYWLNELCRATYIDSKLEISPIKFVIRAAENVMKEHYKKRGRFIFDKTINLLVEKKPEIGNPLKLLELYSRKYGFKNMGDPLKWSDSYYYMSKDLN
jgi:hypothetical protein